MSQDAAPSRLLSIPLELRRKVYGFASQRPHPNLILKEYLEKTDPDVGPPQAPVNPTNGDGGESEHSDDEEQDPGSETMEEDAEIEEPETQQEDEDIAMTDVEAEDSDEPEVTANTSIAAAMQHVAEVGEDESDEEGGNDNEEDADDGEDEADGDGASGQDDEAAAEGDDEDDNGDEQDEDDGNAAPAPQPAPRREYTGRNTKYRHMLKTIKTRGCPPPINLLQVNKQIHDEATEYHYSTSFIAIDVTAAFAHQSFFEETLEKFKNNAFSPLEQVRKVKITLTWDSEWLREKTTPPDAELESDWAFEHYLNERIDRTLEMLAAAPSLRQVEIDWHDTEQTDLGERRMGDAFMKFTSLESKKWTDHDTEPPAQKSLEVSFRRHVSEAGTAHARNSLLAKRRTEFDQILASGMAFR
ncbi:hypothetical protein FKW77_005239 [Venturia effusa]|uniref:Uncharacterized protein n=1 Tax=Venturia effusa TaxID=50376 RepID=A0A517L3A0_9PEZI|nr:hypothetical protein FKW77_005239 [Venturia effusa]